MKNKVEPYQRTVCRSWALFGLICGLYLMGVSYADAAKKDRGASRVQFQDVIAKARVLSETPFQEPGQNLPDVLKKMGYDQWRGIRFKPARSLWWGQPFSLQFFHPGFLYSVPRIVRLVAIRWQFRGDRPTVQSSQDKQQNPSTSRKTS